jgi:F-type H+-transporting ATPase subunit a
MDTGQALAHLVPVGTPYILMPLIVIIELVRSLIRPLTLAVRLAANIVAGHLLMTLISSPLVHSEPLASRLILSGLILLIVLESAVAFIQAYVFRILRALYLGESNTLSLN